MPGLPLVSHTSLNRIVARSADGAVTVRRFLADVTRVAKLLPTGGHVFNMCGDRYRFSVGLAAAIVAASFYLHAGNRTPHKVVRTGRVLPDRQRPVRGGPALGALPGNGRRRRDLC